MTRIPSEADFARAKDLARKRSRGLDAIADRTRDRFQPRCPLHNIYVLPQMDVDFRVYVFFEKDSDLHLSEADGTRNDIENFVLSELEREGRGKRGEMRLAFEFDSDENVARNFEGDYLLRLR